MTGALPSASPLPGTEPPAADWREAPWWQPLRPGLDTLQGAEPDDATIAELNRRAAAQRLRNEAGLPVTFVPGREALSAVGYETRIATAGQVSTRLGGRDGWHDWFNAVVWLAWPRLKARLNRLHEQMIAAEPGRRGRVRDALTLFDENAALVVTADPAVGPALHAHRWQTLFVEQRDQWLRSVRVLLFGHGLMQRMLRPYPSLCAKAWIVEVEPDVLAAIDAGRLDALDAAVAAALTPARLDPRGFAPLPVLGVPGWWPANEDPSFYNDRAVFRPARGAVEAAARTTRTASTGTPDSSDAEPVDDTEHADHAGGMSAPMTNRRPYP
ncbi:MAG TPA: DUF3025 domain-containing protein [Burkholderiaceae bacterium]|nr:DUF3025 domain-containing protein [Burkholderiaceae bacterium]